MHVKPWHYAASVAAIALALAAPASAQPVPLAPGSTLTISGTSTVSPVAITFPGRASLDGVSGSFSRLGTCADCVLMSPVTYAPSVLPGQLFFVENNGPLGLSIGTFLIGSGAATGTAPAGIEITGVGSAILSGFATTPATFRLAAGGGAAAGFSLTVVAQAVPEPASLVLLGAGLAGLLAPRRRLSGR